MIYVCIPSYDEAATVGLLLWKIRQVFTAFPREYQLLVADDASTDATAEVLAPYIRVLPLTVVRHPEHRGYARTVEALLRLAVERSDRPKRDCAVLIHADFAHDPQLVAELVRRIESGADLVVAEGELQGEPSRSRRLLRRWAPLLLRGAVSVPGVKDIVSGYAAFRLVTLRNAMRSGAAPFLVTDGWSANAELLGRTARFARRVEVVSTVERHNLRQRPSRVDPWVTARELWRARRRIELPAPEPRRAPAAEPEVASG